ncbi:MAG: DUF4321 domain-containing protein [Ruminococcus sp.]|nr:DUF4321 domain-containing protein [Ruminococcus sp.]
MANFKKFLVYLAVFAIAVGIGSALASIGAQFASLSFLAITPSFGFEPFTLNLVVLDFTFGLHIHPSVAHIIMIIITIFVAPKIANTLVK